MDLNQAGGKPIAVLAVDDEPDLELLVRKFFRPRIKREELEFLFARNGFEAIETLQNRPDIELVLTDLNMPGMDGLTLLDRLGTFDRQLPAIVISAYGDMENIQAAMNLGAFDFLTKPIDFDDLTVTIERATSQGGAPTAPSATA